MPSHRRSLAALVALPAFALPAAAAHAAPSFAPAVTSPLANGAGPGPAPTTTGLLDADGDGRLDLASTAQFGQGEVLVSRGLGDGRFAAARPVPGTSGVQSLTAADLDGDGRRDLLGMSGYEVVTAIADGAGGFAVRARTPVVLGAQVQAVAADLDADGDRDVAVPTFAAVQVLRNDGTGRLAAGPTTPVAGVLGLSAVDPADLDGDALGDVLAVDGATGTVVALRGTGGGRLTASGRVVATGLIPEDVEAVDLDGDDRDDVAVVGSFSFTVATALTDGRGAFATPIATYRGSQPGPTSVAGADLDGDGLEDLVVSSLANPAQGTVEVLRGTGTVRPASAGTHAVAPFPQDPAIGDLDGDGRPDVATASPGTASALVQR